VHPQLFDNPFGMERPVGQEGGRSNLGDLDRQLPWNKMNHLCALVDEGRQMVFLERLVMSYSASQKKEDD
jgi:hypothetical protein